MKAPYEKNIAIIWSGTITGRKLLHRERVQIFQNIGHDDVQGVVEQLDFSNISMVIGAPGIAAEIRRLVPVPVIIDYPRYIDVLETLKIVETQDGLCEKKIALILHKDNFIRPERIGYYIKNTVDLFSYNDKTQMRPIIEAIREEGYALVIGGPTAVRMANKCRVKAVELIYGEQTLIHALDKAQEMLRLMENEMRSLGRLKAVLDVIPDGIIETNEQGRVNLCNRQALEMLSLKPAEVIGQDIGRLLGDASWKQVLHTQQPQIDVLFSYKGDRFFSTRQPVLEENRVAGSVGTLQKANKIQLLDSKFRSQQNHGHVAKYTFGDIIHQSQVMRTIIECAKLYSNSNFTVLIEGETGTGKEIFAQSIHNASPRHMGPFVAINCAALTETLLESELMGYDEGAFSGAKRGGKIGLFERANKGTIFLDEISELPLSLQAKILRVLQEKNVMHLGGDRIIPIDVRIIAATNLSLERLITSGKFRQDLFYRLNVLNLTLPPLRQRPEDISLLFQHFAKNTPDGNNLDMRALMSFVAGYEWPGNIRELQNYVERCSVIGGTQKEEALAYATRLNSSLKPDTVFNGMSEEKRIHVVPGTLKFMQQQLVCEVLKRCGGNKSKAALLLGLSRNSVHGLVKGTELQSSHTALT